MPVASVEDAERLGHRLQTRRLYDGGAHRPPELLEPARHGASIDRDAVAAKAGLEAVKRHPPPELFVDDVPEHRRRGQRARQDLLGDGSRLEHGIVAERLVLGSGDDEPALTAALPGKLAALLEVPPRRLALVDERLEDGVGDLDPYLGDLETAQVAAARRLVVLATVTGTGGRRATCSACGRWLRRDLTREFVERRELRGELELELLAVDPFGLRDEDPMTQHLELLT